MALLDWFAGGVRGVIRTVSPDLSEVVWLPVMAVLLCIVLFVVVRKGMPIGSKVGRFVLRAAVAVVIGGLFLLDFLLVSLLRGIKVRPPELLYAYGDAVTTVGIKLVDLTGQVSGALMRMAKMHGFFIVLFTVAVLWSWNQGHCGDSVVNEACAKPVAQWVTALDG